MYQFFCVALLYLEDSIGDFCLVNKDYVPQIKDFPEWIITEAILRTAAMRTRDFGLFLNNNLTFSITSDAGRRMIQCLADCAHRQRSEEVEPTGSE